MTLLALGATRAHALGLYLDLGVGANAMFYSSLLFPGTPSAMGIAASGNTFLGFELNPSSTIKFHLGAAGRLNIGTSSTTYASYVGLYPTFRIETYRFYISAGIAPFLWTRQSAQPGIDYTFLTTAAMGGFAEFGLLWRVTSEFNMALAVSADIVAQGANPFASAWSPLPVWGAFVAMRFYIFSAKGSGGGGGSSGKREYDGWRYPFGIEKK